MPHKTLQQWLRADNILWKVFWKYIDEIEEAPKQTRPAGGRSRGGWHWPAHIYDCSEIFRARFNLDGTVRYSYAEIAEQAGIQVKDKAGFVAGIIQRMLRTMSHPEYVFTGKRVRNDPIVTQAIQGFKTSRKNPRSYCVSIWFCLPASGARDASPYGPGGTRLGLTLRLTCRSGHGTGVVHEVHGVTRISVEDWSS
jgi:hypothetical protein